jgi:hypothetical protein
MQQTVADYHDDGFKCMLQTDSNERREAFTRLYHLSRQLLTDWEAAGSHQPIEDWVVELWKQFDQETADLLIELGQVMLTDSKEKKEVPKWVNIRTKEWNAANTDKPQLPLGGIQSITFRADSNGSLAKPRGLYGKAARFIITLRQHDPEFEAEVDAGHGFDLTRDAD